MSSTKKFLQRRAQQEPAPGLPLPTYAPQARTRAQHHDWVTLDLDRLSLDGGTQSRVELDAIAIEDYTARMVLEPLSGLVLDPDGEPWPALVVFDDGEQRWLADGFHRARAARTAGLTRFQVELKRGELRDAVRLSLSVNAKHGLRRTTADKRQAIQRALRDAEWVTYSDRKLAELCAISAPTVARWRHELEERGAIQVVEERTGQDGRQQGAPRQAAAAREGARAGSTAPLNPTTAARGRASSRAQLNRAGLQPQALLQALPLASALRVAQLDTLTHSDPRKLVILTSTQLAHLHTTLDHLDKLLATRHATLLLPLPDLKDVSSILDRLTRRAGRTSLVAMSHSQQLLIAHTTHTSLAIPAWIEGIGDLLDLLDEPRAHLLFEDF